MPISDSLFTLGDDGIYSPSYPIVHRDNEFDSAAFNTLFDMQVRHFWYRGRHRFLLRALDEYCAQVDSPLSAVDLGGGCGGWIAYLAGRRGHRLHRLALADSSRTALAMAAPMLPAHVDRYQIDLMNLAWQESWDMAFLLDVIEHLPDDAEALRQAREALKPGGFLFVTAPAFRQFWSYNDELAHHLRRYTRADFRRLAQDTGLKFCDARYFMFLLSPAYWFARKKRGIGQLSKSAQLELMKGSHEVPPALLNEILATIFAMETPIGHWFRFPWGTSVLGVFQKPCR